MVEARQEHKNKTIPETPQYLTSAPGIILRALWSTVLLTLTSLMEQRNASGYKKLTKSHKNPDNEDKKVTSSL